MSMNDQIEQKGYWNHLRQYLKKNPNMQYRNVNITSFEIVEAIIRKNKEKF